MPENHDSEQSPTLSEAEDMADDKSRMRGYMRDVAALAMLPASWTGRGPFHIAGSLVDALLSTLRADLIYVCLNPPLAPQDIEAVRAHGRPDAADKAHEVGLALAPWLVADVSAAAATISDPISGGSTSIVVRNIGFAGKIGSVVAGASRTDFPTEQERLLLSVAVNQAATALQEVLTQTALRRSERELEDFFQNAVVGLHWQDPDGIILRANRAVLNLLGCHSDEIVGHHVEEFYQDPAAVQVMLRRLRNGETVRDYEASILCRDGSIKSVLIDANVLWEEHRYVHARCFTRDVTDRKQAEDAHRASEERYRLLFEACPAGYLLLDRAGHIDAWNPAAERIFGWTAAEAMAEPTVKFIVPEHLWPKVKQLLSGSVQVRDTTEAAEEDSIHNALAIDWVNPIETGDESDDGVSDDPEGMLGILIPQLLQVRRPVISTNENITKDGRIIICDWLNIPLLNSEGNATHSISLVQDITERKRAEGDLQASEIRYRQLSEDLELRVHERTAELSDSVRALNLEVAEREQAERASLAQTDTLIRTTEQLTSGLSLAEFPGIVLAAIVEQLNAVGGSLWDYDETTEVSARVLDYERRQMVRTGGRLSAIYTVEHRGAPGWESIKERFIRGECLLLSEHEPEAFLDQESRQSLAEQGIRTLLVVPLLLHGRLTGYYELRSTRQENYGPRDLELAQALAHQATLAIQWTNLAEQAQLTAVLDERNRMARDIHDTIAQSFTGILMQLGAAERLLTLDPARGLTHLQAIRDQAVVGLREVRRSIEALRPEALEEMDLAAALTSMVRQRNQDGTPRLDFRIHGHPKSLPPDVSEHILRIGQEAVTNALRHSEALMVRMNLAFEESEVRLTIEDDGKGFAAETPQHRHGYGLTGMRERAGIIGAAFTVTSHPGHGTVIDVRWTLTALEVGQAPE